MTIINSNRHRIIQEFKELQISYPKLHSLSFDSQGNGTVFGDIDVVDSSEILWKTFSISIFIPIEYPKCLPIVFEKSNIIKKDPDWHINNDGSCCVGPETNIYSKLDSNITLKRWMDKIVMPWFFDQVHRLERGYYLGNVYMHGANGLIQDYKRRWGLNTKEAVIKKLRLIGKQVKIRRNEQCYCRSGKKYKKCHLIKDDYEGVPIALYIKDLESILLESENNTENV